MNIVTFLFVCLLEENKIYSKMGLNSRDISTKNAEGSREHNEISLVHH
jgi:hypothetical protein